MKVLGRTYFGKVMLFGEYAVISGSYAALLPYASVKANLALPDAMKADSSAHLSNMELLSFHHYLKRSKDKELSHCLDLSKLKADLERGLFFHSTIPEKYGLGSSGAVCAAILEHYSNDLNQLKQMPIHRVKSFFMTMESFFHGSSSGLDPLSIFLGEPLIIRNNEYIIPGKQGAFCANQMQIFLIDTMKQGETRENMTRFKNQMKDDHFQNWFNGFYIPMVNQTVEEWMNGKLKEDTIFALSREQLQFMHQMIPPAYNEIWLKGVYTGMYALKLCGSGGGGMLLGFTDDISGTRNYLHERYQVNITIL